MKFLKRLRNRWDELREIWLYLKEKAKEDKYVIVMKMDGTQEKRHDDYDDE